MKNHSLSTFKGNFIEYNRGFYRILQHAPIIAKCITVSLTSVFIWTWFHNRGLYFRKMNDVIGIAITFIGVAYGVHIGLVLAKVGGEFKKMSAAVVKKNLRVYLTYRDEQITSGTHMTLISLAILVLTLVISLDFGEIVWAGRLVVFATTYTFALLQLTAVQMDDPMNTTWFQVKVPPHWPFVNIDDFFDENTKESAITLAKQEAEKRKQEKK